MRVLARLEGEDLFARSRHRLMQLMYPTLSSIWRDLLISTRFSNYSGAADFEIVWLVNNSLI